MVVRELDVTNFRNIESASLGFSGTFNFITGRNAQGKTNLLEAIHFFSLGRSFRTRRNEELVMFGREYAHLRLKGTSDTGINFLIEIGLDRGGGVRVSVNGKRLSGMADVIGIIPAVIFSPLDVTLASGAPAGRRAYLDFTAAQVSAAFLRELREFRRILKQRNAALRRIAAGGTDGRELYAWDEAFISKGASIVKGREEILGEISKGAIPLFGEIMPDSAELKMEYACSFNPEGLEPETALREAVQRTKDVERSRGYTVAGPHNDDFRIYLGTSELRRYGSQGQQRVTAVVLKLAQAAAIMERRSERPVVLLDDIFSELDVETAARVRAHLTDRYQSFISSPRRDVVAQYTGGATEITIEGGRTVEG